jgi:uroporphyrinogen decarboxylase
MTTHRERMEACLAGETPDRPPVALWRHFPVDDQSPEGLAAAILQWQRTFDFDFVKVTPASSYCLKDWGAEDVWRGNPEGTREYGRRVIQNPEDWERLRVLDPSSPHIRRELDCLHMLAGELGADTPMIQTIFNPLSQAKNLVGGQQLLVHMRRFPDALRTGLEIIAESTRRFIEALHNTGVAGIFYAVQHAQYGLLTEAEYNTFGRAYDLRLLQAAEPMWIKLLHLHGLDVMFDLVKDYPVNIINWHDRETWPSLGAGMARYPGAACGGVNIDTLVFGDAEAVRREAFDALNTAEGRRFILGTGCVTPIIAPYGNILAVRQAVEG